MISKSIKKLLLEEKAKAYDEALKKIKECTPDENGFVTIYPSEIFPELAESEDERIRKAIISGMTALKEQGRETFAAIHINDCIAWLEKQGSPEVPQATGPDPIAAKFQVGDRVIHKTIPGFECIIENIDNTTYYGDTTNFDIVDQDKWEKAIPKFHVQDWITDGYRTERVLDIKGPDYILQSQDGDDTYYDPISYVDPRYHHWTIQDVRFGDILIDDSGIYVFEKPKDLDNTAYFCSCAYRYSDKKFKYTSMIRNLPGARLASKDQCEDFFLKMKDAGYEWDPDEKKPIENKTKDDPDPTLLMYLPKAGEPGAPCSANWDQNDEDMLAGISAYVCSPDGFQEWYDWLQSLKDRIRMQSWRDSDKEWLKAAISYVEHCAFTTIGKGRLATIAWLKSLENKVWPEQVWDIDDEHNLQGIIDEIKANKSEAAGNDAGTYDRFLEFLESLRDRVGKSSYDPYKAVIESILAMCEKYKDRMEDKESARDFLNNIRVKCKDAEEYDRNNQTK
jgi:hypothetical protein